jgi:hypothetical protein
MVRCIYVKEDGTSGYFWRTESNAGQLMNTDKSVLLECGCRTLPVFERVELDEEEVDNRKDRKDWKNDKMVRATLLRFQNVCVSSTVILSVETMNIMVCGMAEEGALLAHQLTRESRAMKRR